MVDWIEWKHGRMSGESLMPPWEHGVKDDEVIIVRFRNGRESTNQANRFSWYHAGGGDDVVAFQRLDHDAIRQDAALIANDEQAIRKSLNERYPIITAHLAKND